MGKIKTLVIEDNPDNWLAVKSSLRKHAVCTLTETVADGIKKFEEEEFDLVLLDLHLPDGSGLKFVKHVRTGVKQNDIPVYAVSASVQLEFANDSIKAGCNGFIAKPFTRSELIEQLKEHLPHE